jgi:hypothetical protein
MVRAAAVIAALLLGRAALAAPLGFDVRLTSFQEYTSCGPDSTQICFGVPTPVDIQFQYAIDVEFNASALVVNTFSTPFLTGVHRGERIACGPTIAASLTGAA